MVVASCPRHLSGGRGQVAIITRLCVRSLWFRVPYPTHKSWSLSLKAEVSGATCSWWRTLRVLKLLVKGPHQHVVMDSKHQLTTPPFKPWSSLTRIKKMPPFYHMLAAGLPRLFLLLFFPSEHPLILRGRNEIKTAEKDANIVEPSSKGWRRGPFTLTFTYPVFFLRSLWLHKTLSCFSSLLLVTAWSSSRSASSSCHGTYRVHKREETDWFFCYKITSTVLSHSCSYYHRSHSCWCMDPNDVPWTQHYMCFCVCDCIHVWSLSKMTYMRH